MPEPLPPIRHPSRYVPLAGIATGQPGDPAVAVSPANPVPSREQPLRGARALAADTPVAAGAVLLVDCSAEGIATFRLEDGSTLALTLPAGLTMMPLALIELVGARQTAALNAWIIARAKNSILYSGSFAYPQCRITCNSKKPYGSSDPKKNPRRL